MLEALLRSLGADVNVVDTLPWKNVVHYRPGGSLGREGRLVRGAALRARELGAVLVFVRDRDRDERRAEQIERALETVLREAGPRTVIGGVAVELLESWLLALLGTRGSEALSRDRAIELVSRRAQAKSTEAYVSIVESADLARVPDDAKSLLAWIARARSLLDAP